MVLHQKIHVLVSEGFFGTVIKSYSARFFWKFVLNLLWLLDRFWAYLLVKLNCSHVALHCLHTRLKYLLFSLEKNLVCSISFTFLKFWNQNNILLRILRFPAKNFEFDWLSTLTTTQLAQYLRKNYFRKMKKLQTKWRPLQLFQRLKLHFRSP